MIFRRCVIGLLFLAGFAAAQTPLRFEAASIKRHPADDPNGGIGPHPGGFKATGIPLKVIIQMAYRMREYQILGGPDWLNTDRYDILAKAADGINPNHEQLTAMLQTLLAERFGLKTHRETRELPAFALVVAKGGPKLKPKAASSNLDDHPFEGKGSGPLISVGRGIVMGQKITMADLADALGNESDRKIVDQTGISGDFDVTLKWTPDGGAQDNSGTPLVTAIQEQLGLKLESIKAGVEMLVIDSVQKASEN